MGGTLWLRNPLILVILLAMAVELGKLQQRFVVVRGAVEQTGPFVAGRALGMACPVDRFCQEGEEHGFTG